MNRAAHATAGSELRVRGIDDSVKLEHGDVDQLGGEGQAGTSSQPVTITAPWMPIHTMGGPRR